MDCVDESDMVISISALQWELDDEMEDRLEVEAVGAGGAREMKG